MATLGSLGNAWQYAAGAPDAARAHPKLLEAFGSDPRQSAGFGGFGSRASSSAFAGVASAYGEEVPRVFSAKAMHSSLGGEMLLQAPRTVDPLVNAGASSQGDPCWVTVFGFPGRAASAVRQQLEAMCGPIAEVQHGDGNFMHVRFHSAAAASQCLAHNGTAIVGKLLIGCVPCTSALVAGYSSRGTAPGAGISGDFEDDEHMYGGPASLIGGGRQPVGQGWGSMNMPQGQMGSGWAGGPQVIRANPLWRLLDLLFDV